MKGVLFTVTVCTLAALGIHSCADSDYYKRDQVARLENERREATPHVIREADGCKVYAFKAGEKYHFFTRCPNSKTATEKAWEDCEGAGKLRRCQDKTETIESM